MLHQFFERITIWTLINSIPEWDEGLNRIDKEEAWKWREELQLAEALYNQWSEVFNLATAFAEGLPGEDEANSAKDLINQNAYIMHPKLLVPVETLCTRLRWKMQPLFASIVARYGNKFLLRCSLAQLMQHTKK